MNGTTALETADIDQLKAAFAAATAAFLEKTEQKLILARTLNDRESMVKEHIKMQVMKEARGIFHRCYLNVLQNKESEPGLSPVIFL
jgi:cobalamin biosynthesis protein CbiG